MVIPLVAGATTRMALVRPAGNGAAGEVQVARFITAVKPFSSGELTPLILRSAQQILQSLDHVRIVTAIALGFDTPRIY